MRSAGCLRIASVTTFAGEAGTAHTAPTFRFQHMHDNADDARDPAIATRHPPSPSNLRNPAISLFVSFLNCRSFSG
jgi:hypothetical protein